MKAVSIRKYGAAAELELGERDQPVAGSGEYLVRVAAASVNPIDWKIRSGMLRFIKRIKFPYIPGSDVCGEVVEAGGGASSFQKGDSVYGMLPITSGGAYAEYAVLPEKDLAPKPENLNAQETGALPIVALTALQVLRDKLELASGQKILLIGASGGVGHVAVQIAKAMGAEVTAVCGTRNVEWMRELGADRVIDYKNEDYHDSGETYDAIFDIVAVDSYPGCSSLLAPAGRYVTTLPGPGIAFYSMILPLFSKRRAAFFEVQPSGADLRQINQWIDGGALKPKVAKVYAPSEAVAAHEESEAGRVVGKLILDFSGS